MAEILDDGEFWLNQVLSDDGDNTKVTLGLDKGSVKRTLPFEFPYGFDSFESPIDYPLLSSTESESHDYRARAAHFRFEDDFKKTDSKGSFFSGSPQSTLCPSNGSPNGPSPVSSPPATWDLLFAAQEELARMRLEGVKRVNHMNELLGLSIKQHSRPYSPYYQHNSLSHQQVPAIQLEQLKQQLMMKHRSSKVWSGPPAQVVQPGARNGVQPLGLSPSAWPCLQQSRFRQQQSHNVSNMRAVFLAPSGVKSQSAGTGVFLPRQMGTTQSMPPRKKPGFSPVLLPARVVQALNLNLEELGRSIGDASLRVGDGNVVAQQKRYLRPQQAAVMNNDLQLPQEWTY